MTHRTPLRRLLLGLALITAGLSAGAHADNEQYFPLQSYRVGPYAAGGTGFFGGFIDYLQYINANGWGERRQADLERVRNGVCGGEGRGMLRAPQGWP